MDLTIISPYRLCGQSELSGPTESALNWYTRRYAQALTSQGHSVTILGPRAGADTLNVTWMDDDIVVEPTFNRGSALCVLHLIRRAATLRHKIVHIQHEPYAYGGIWGALLMPALLLMLTLRHCRVITTMHAVIPLGEIRANFMRANMVPIPAALVRIAWVAFLRLIATFSDCVHVHEVQQRRRLLSEYRLNREKIRVIPLGISPNGVVIQKQPARAKFNLGVNDRVVLFFGYLSFYKGISEFIRDLPLLFEATVDISVVIAGAVPMRLRGKTDFEERIAYLTERTPRLKWVGFVPDELVGDLFTAADLLVLPYTVDLSSSGPMSLAVTYGTPAIVSDVISESYPGIPLTFSLEPGMISDAIQLFFNDESIRDRSRRPSVLANARDRSRARLLLRARGVSGGRTQRVVRARSIDRHPAHRGRARRSESAGWVPRHRAAGAHRARARSSRSRARRRRAARGGYRYLDHLARRDHGRRDRRRRRAARAASDRRSSVSFRRRRRGRRGFRGRRRPARRRHGRILLARSSDAVRRSSRQPLAALARGRVALANISDRRRGRRKLRARSAGSWAAWRADARKQHLPSKLGRRGHPRPLFDDYVVRGDDRDARAMAEAGGATHRCLRVATAH